MEENRTPFRFAVMGAGNIANKFCSAVKLLQNCTVAAVASKSMERASAFAQKNGIEKAYDSYEQLLIETKPDCVYIAVTSDAHYELSMLCLKYGVAVLCEKAMFLNSAQAKEVFALARQKKVFVMEAMWSRFLPAVRKAKEWVESGRIGTPVYGRAAIGFHAPEDAGNRYFSPALGGGAAYDLTVYCYEIMTYLIDRPVEVVNAAAVFGETGVDVTDHVLLRFADEADSVAEAESMDAVDSADKMNGADAAESTDETESTDAADSAVKKDGTDKADCIGKVGGASCEKDLRSPGKSVVPKRREMFAVCESTFLANLGDRLVIYGSRGRLEVPAPHYASEAFLYDEQGNCIEYYKDEETENGFVYEVQETVNCIRTGKIESETVPHALTASCAEMFDLLVMSAVSQKEE